MTVNTPLERLVWQDVLFAARLNRFQLIKLGARTGDDTQTLLVLRNHAFETAAAVLPPFFTFAEIGLNPVYSDYDDSLASPAQPAAAAAVLVWMDFARLAELDDASLSEWLIGRLGQVRARCDGFLVVANAPDGDVRSERLNLSLDRWAAATAGVAVLRLDAIARDLGAGFFDPARAEATGTRYSDQAVLRAARALGLEILPGVLGRPLKAIAIDLDNTLYAGVLAEDGPVSVALTPGHLALQAELVRWAEKGVLLAIVSRNEPSDVEQLFEMRQDFPLRPEMIASWQVGWGDKSAAIAGAAAAFNIAPDSFLVIDDNAGELIEIAQAHPGARLLFAGPAADGTAAVVRGYPALPRGEGGFAGRAQDVQANREREAIANAVDEDAYLQALQPVLTFSLDPQADRKRLAELSAKTNQFNLALRRFDELEVDRYLTETERAVVHVRLADRLADSGSVAAVFMRRDGEVLVVDEICISCRALGRRLETVIVGAALRRGAAVLGTRTIAFAYARGPRNAPARAWLEAALGRALPSEQGRIEAGPPPLAMAIGGKVRLTWTGDMRDTASEANGG